MTPKQTSGQVKITITKVLEESLWGAKECLDESGEAALIEMVMEDTSELLNNAEWTVEVEQI